MVTLWYVEYCENNIGIWTKDWFATEKEATDRYEELIAEHGKRDDATGTYGDVCEVQLTIVDLTLEGILTFANEFAVDTGAT